MDSLADLLKDKKIAKPDGIDLIKDYVMSRWQSDCTVTIQKNAVILNVPNSALAGTIQLHKQQLIRDCQLDDKRLVIRTGK